MSHFETFQISPLRLDIELNALEKKFHELSKKFHPDHHQDEVNALEDSSKINGAYRILKDSWARAGYLLELAHIPLGTKVPACLGSIYFEIQEAGDANSLRALKDQLIQDNEKRDRQLKESFKAFDQLQLAEKDLQSKNPQALLVLNKLAGLVLENRYAHSMQRDIESKVTEARSA